MGTQRMMRHGIALEHTCPPATQLLYDLEFLLEDETNEEQIDERVGGTLISPVAN